jgi:hypothetical protein
MHVSLSLSTGSSRASEMFVGFLEWEPWTRLFIFASSLAGVVRTRKSLAGYMRPLVIPCCTETRKKINSEPIRTAQKHEVTVANPSRQARPSPLLSSRRLPTWGREGEKGRTRSRWLRRLFLWWSRCPGHIPHRRPSYALQSIYINT